jgi:hypothetical protein
VLHSDNFSLVINNISSSGTIFAKLMAKDRPEMPPPIIKKPVFSFNEIFFQTPSFYKIS